MAYTVRVYLSFSAEKVAVVGSKLLFISELPNYLNLKCLIRRPVHDYAEKCADRRIRPWIGGDSCQVRAPRASRGQIRLQSGLDGSGPGGGTKNTVSPSAQNSKFPADGLRDGLANGRTKK